MAKLNIRFTKTFLFISFILIMAIVGGIFYFTAKNHPAQAVAIVDFHGKQLIVNATTLEQISVMAQQQNVTLNRSLAIERLVELQVLQEQAKYLNIAPSKEQIDATFSQQVANLESQGLTAALAQQNMSRAVFETNLRNSIEQDLTLQLLFNQEVVSKLKISDDQLKTVYDANPAAYIVPETVSVKHILVCYADAPQCTINLTKDEAQQSIIAIYRALSENASFDDLARQYSTDIGSGKNGGDIGRISKGQTVPQFETVAFDTPVGQTSLPFESPYGFHILRVYNHQAATQLTFEQVAPQIKQQVILQQANSLQQAYIAGLMSGATVTVVG